MAVLRRSTVAMIVSPGRRASEAVLARCTAMRCSRAVRCRSSRMCRRLRVYASVQRVVSVPEVVERMAERRVRRRSRAERFGWKDWRRFGVMSSVVVLCSVYYLL